MGVTSCESQRIKMPAHVLLTACCRAKVKGDCLETSSTVKIFSADVQRHVLQHPRHGKAAMLFAALQSNPYERRCLHREFSLLRRFWENRTDADLNSLAFSTSTAQAQVPQTLWSRFYKLLRPHGIAYEAARRAL